MIESLIFNHNSATFKAFCQLEHTKYILFDVHQNEKKKSNLCFTSSESLLQIEFIHLIVYIVLVEKPHFIVWWMNILSNCDLEWFMRLREECKIVFELTVISMIFDWLSTSIPFGIRFMVADLKYDLYIKK